MIPMIPMIPMTIAPVAPTAPQTLSTLDAHGPVVDLPATSAMPVGDVSGDDLPESTRVPC